MVSGDEVHTAHVFNEIEKFLDARIALFASRNSSSHVASVTHHIRVGIVDTNDVILAREQGFLAGGGDFPRLHQRCFVERHIVARDLNICLELFVEVARTVTVPEESHVTELLSLRARKSLQSVLCKPLPGSAFDERRGHEKVRRKLQVTIVLHQTNKFGLREAHAVESIETGFVFERLGNFHDAVGAKVGDDDGIVILNGTNRLAIRIDDHEWCNVLISDATFFKLNQRLLRARKLVRRLAQHVRPPTALNHAPVGFVAVHSHRHASSTRSNLCVTSLSDIRVQFSHELGHVFVARTISNVTTIRQDVQPKSLAPIRERPAHHAKDLIRSRVHTTIRQQSNNMQRVILKCRLDVRPTRIREHVLLPQRNVHERRALRDDLARPERVVPHLGVPHVIIRG
mmetsp:Transcript_5658/g.20552  ORF Transcript_5658/g.20552 Transcript_5658/m.20552 type:complete len:400 (+) Transcript_5658:335-1534(+)